MKIEHNTTSMFKEGNWVSSVSQHSERKCQHSWLTATTESRRSRSHKTSSTSSIPSRAHYSARNDERARGGRGPAVVDHGRAEDHAPVWGRGNADILRDIHLQYTLYYRLRISKWMRWRMPFRNIPCFLIDRFTVSPRKIVAICRSQKDSYGRYTGWLIRLFSRFCWHQNRSFVLVNSVNAAFILMSIKPWEQPDVLPCRDLMLKLEKTVGKVTNLC